MFAMSCPRFVYDADGNLTKIEGHVGGQPPKRMVYIGGIYEKNMVTGEVTKYYHTSDGRRLATRKGSTLTYFANDHLGGTTVVMDSAGNKISETRYFPYGSIWTQASSATPPTDKLFTGQRRYGPKSSIYYYGARFYSADIGRFLQADSIVPEPRNPQALNRYSYVVNNPIRYCDPTGHCFGEAPVSCDGLSAEQVNSLSEEMCGCGGAPAAPVSIYEIPLPPCKCLGPGKPELKSSEVPVVALITGPCVGMVVADGLAPVGDVGCGVYALGVGAILACIAYCGPGIEG